MEPLSLVSRLAADRSTSGQLKARRELMGRCQQRVVGRLPDSETRGEFWASLVDGGYLDALIADPKADPDQAVDQRLDAFQARGNPAEEGLYKRRACR